MIGTRPSCSFWAATRVFSSTRSLSALDKSKMKRTEEGGKADVVSLNILTNDRSIVQLSHPTGEKKSFRFRRQYSLPKEAVGGLREVVLKSNENPKQLQNNADQLVEKLKNRRFPASPEIVKSARNQLRKIFKKKYEDEGFGDELISQSLGEKVKEAQESRLQLAVDKAMKKSQFNWRPMGYDSPTAAIAYALARLPANYSEMARVLEELQRVKDFEPETVLDYGSGCGGAFWAINERFNKSLKEYTCVELNDHMTRVAMDIMRGDSDDPSALVHSGISFRRQLLPSLQTTYDIVICHRTLIEVGSQEARFELAEQLWNRTNRYLILVESGLDDAFAALMDVRNFLISCGQHVDLPLLVTQLQEKGRWGEATERLIGNTNLTDYERVEMLRELLPDFDLPTIAPPATVFAPCPHDLGCPLHNNGSCSFTVRWHPIRADGRPGKRNDDGTESGTFSFVILEKGRRLKEKDPLSRILVARKLNAHVSCDLCTAFKGLQRLTISKRAGELYKRVKERRSGELFPLSMEQSDTESQFDLYDHSVEANRRTH